MNTQKEPCTQGLAAYRRTLRELQRSSKELQRSSKGALKGVWRVSERTLWGAKEGPSKGPSKGPLKGPFNGIGPLHSCLPVRGSDLLALKGILQDFPHSERSFKGPLKDLQRSFHRQDLGCFRKTNKNIFFWWSSRGPEK